MEETAAIEDDEDDGIADVTTGDDEVVPWSDVVSCIEVVPRRLVVPWGDVVPCADIVPGRLVVPCGEVAPCAADVVPGGVVVP